MVWRLLTRLCLVGGLVLGAGNVEADDKGVVKVAGDNDPFVWLEDVTGESRLIGSRLAMPRVRSCCRATQSIRSSTMTFWRSWIQMRGFPWSPSMAITSTTFGKTNRIRKGFGDARRSKSTRNPRRNGMSFSIWTNWPQMKKRVGCGTAWICCDLTISCV